MKNRLILLPTILFFVTVTFSQTVSTNKRFSPTQYSSIKIDLTTQNIIYRYDFIENLKSKEIKSSLTVLQIGQNFSNFTDLNILKRDSLENKYSSLESVGIKEINQLLPVINKIGFKKSVFKNLKNDTLTSQGKVHSIKYEYKEKTPNLSWKLDRSNKSILNYKVKKATVNYGGRKWIAWYTEEIPINLGPYVFGNLPGLILELYDDKKNFHFLAIGINNSKKEIYKRVERKIIKTSKEDFLKAERNFHEKPELFIRGTIRGGANFKKIPYNPIEIID